MTYISPEGKEYGTGAVVRSPIYRNVRRALANKKLAGAGEPYNWTTQRKVVKVPIKNQQGSYSCGGQAGSYLLGDLHNIDGELSAKSIYAPIAYPQGGTTVPALISQLTTCGANTEALIPSKYIGGGCDEALMTDKSFITPTTQNLAKQTGSYTAKHLTIDMESLAQGVRDYGGVILEIRGNNNGSWLSPYPQSNSVGTYWQHFMCIFDAFIDPNGRKVFAAYQSWGESVGDKGVQYFGQDWLDSGNILDLFVLIPNTPIQRPAWYVRWMALLKLNGVRWDGYNWVKIK
jgi:hypothetical protein